ncbi:MAG: hypothetical protein ACLU5E_10485 [Anaerovoracaceae bacterium]
MEATKPIFENNKLMAYYRCAIMEVETKLNVLNEQFSLQYDRNPISSIQTRLKRMDSISEKLKTIFHDSAVDGRKSERYCRSQGHMFFS